MGRRIREFEWSETPLGPLESWPQSLRSGVSMLLPSEAPIVLFWGRDLTAIYNDAYCRVLASKHPWALGKPAREVWSEIWGSQLQALLEGVRTSGKAYRASDLLFLLERRGFLEETYFDVSYDPVRDETGDVGGVYCIVSDMTRRVLGERRLRALRDVSARTAGLRTAEQVCETACAAFAACAQDLPFAAIHLVESEGASARLVASAGLADGLAAALARVGLTPEDAPSPLRRALEARGSVDVTDLGERAPGALPEEHAEGPTRARAVVLPVSKPGDGAVAGFVTFGVSRRLALDDDYRGFLDLLASQLSAAIANARAHEEERRRAEALAELGRAKTTFFSNVSHEFRTPLALILGPLEEMLEMKYGILPAEAYSLLLVLRRSALRLQKLVNSILDMGRIEAGRAKPTFRPTDLPALTAELALGFRPLCERAGLELVVHTPPLSGPVHVAPDLWENVVLNLVSNAFKFTLSGRIEVRLAEEAEVVRLVVRDTGVGIAPDHLPRLFDRFHRVDGVQGRSIEGSGIGLALVDQLVRLHGGTVTVTSSPGAGTTFTVTLSKGTAHLPADQLGPSLPHDSANVVRGYVEEAVGWLAADVAGRRLDAAPASRTQPAALDRWRKRVLLVDDNADMREYLRRVLGRAYEVEAVADGPSALDRVQRTAPDVVVSDVMLPGMDGFELLRRIRAHSGLETVPVLLLSARAGADSRDEGLALGADDYVVKPFDPQDLLARVATLASRSRGPVAT
jgi:signal transduction histidine kinase/ActR/RegA family two-component response regulator